MRRTLLLLFPLAIGVTRPMLAQQHTCPMKADSGSAMDGMGKMGMMMEHAMMARMDSADARLDSLARAMTTATGSRKMEAMSAVLTALLAQRSDMRRMMHEHMMGPMGMSGASGMMPMADAGCSQAAAPDTTGSHSRQHQH